MLDSNLRMIMAYHEASHAVIARVQGIECLCVVMFSPIEGLAAGTRTPISTYHDAGQFRKGIIVTLAGPCGEMKHRNKPWSRKYLNGGRAITKTPGLQHTKQRLLQPELIPVRSDRSNQLLNKLPTAMTCCWIASIPRETSSTSIGWPSSE